jgi:hypothetical protein
MAARCVVVLKFQDHVAPSRLALQRLAPPGPREQLAAMVGDRLDRRRGIARIRFRIGDVERARLARPGPTSGRADPWRSEFPRRAPGQWSSRSTIVVERGRHALRSCVASRLVCER